MTVVNKINKTKQYLLVCISKQVFNSPNPTCCNLNGEGC